MAIENTGRNGNIQYIPDQTKLTLIVNTVPTLNASVCVQSPKDTSGFKK